MAKRGSIHITWGQDGEIIWNLDFPDKDPDQLYSLGGVALVDHLLSTLHSNNVISFCESVLSGIVNNKIKVKPINSELKSAALELHLGRVLYTLFKAKSQLFCDNQKLEQAISQMAENYIGRLLATVSKANNDAIKFGILGVISSYEKHIRAMHETNHSIITTRTNIAKAVAIFINRFPYALKPEDLEKPMGDIEGLIERLKMLSLKDNQRLFSL